MTALNEGLARTVDDIVGALVDPARLAPSIAQCCPEFCKILLDLGLPRLYARNSRVDL